MGTGRAFHEAGPDIEKALDQVLVFIPGKNKQVSQPDMQAGCFLGFGKLLRIL